MCIKAFLTHTHTVSCCAGGDNFPPTYLNVVRKNLCSSTNSWIAGIKRGMWKNIISIS